MKIALIGYGKMGKTIEKLAIARGYTIVAKLEEKPTKENINGAEVAIEFSTPEAAYENVKACLELKLPVVCGTTAWIDRLSDIKKICNDQKGAFIYSSNYSLGVNLFFEINRQVAEIISKYPEYKVRLEEIHHTEKKDAPSGTAISIADEIMPSYDMKGWVSSTKFEQDTFIGIESKREPNVPGTHMVYYKSEVDEIELKHMAHSRDGFALGALIAAKWLIGKTGFFTMKNVLGFK